jgi:hypothetical protein
VISHASKLLNRRKDLGNLKEIVAKDSGAIGQRGKWSDGEAYKGALRALSAPPVISLPDVATAEGAKVARGESGK